MKKSTNEKSSFQDGNMEVNNSLEHNSHNEKKHNHNHEHSHNHNDCCSHEYGHNHNHGDCCSHDHDHGHGHDHGCGCDCEETDVRKTIGGVVLFFAALIIFHIPGLFDWVSESTMDTVELITYLLIYLITAKDIVVSAIKNVFKGKALDEQFLMTIASLGAFFLGEYSEACAVMLFYLVGEAFQDYAVDRSRDSIVDLMDIRPDCANIIKRDGLVEKVAPDDVKVGDLILVKPGEKVPLDGVVAEGQGELDTSALTGESMPTQVAAGDQVVSGTISLDSALTVKVTKVFQESTVSKILDMMENASEKKTQTEKFITRFARIYTPIVVGLAVAIAVLIPLGNVIIFGADISDFYGVWNDWIYRALTFLVISCPCALVISVPLSFFAGIGLASSKGILIKGSNYLESMAQCNTVVFDKTGTLTKGVFEIVKIKSTVSDKEFLETAAVAEWYSNHPIAISIKKGLKKMDYESMARIEDEKDKIQIQEIHGKGIKARYMDDEISVGNAQLMKQENIIVETTDEIGTLMYVAKNGKYLGYALIADEAKDTSKKAIKELKNLGVDNIVMLTGDIKEIAEHIGRKLGIDKVYSQLMPYDKVKHVEEMLSKDGTLAFVGDGINDAPVLARADVGIAMGAMGSDAAIEAADLVLMDDNPMGVAKAIKLSRKTVRIAKENIVFALTVKIAVLILAAVGVAAMWAAVFADVGVCVIAIINAMRSGK